MRQFVVLALVATLGATCGAGAAHAEPGAGPSDRLGSQESLPPVPQRRRFPAPRVAAYAVTMGSCCRGPARTRERRPRLGARHGRAFVRRPRRHSDGILRSRRRPRSLSCAARPSRRRRARRGRCRRACPACGALPTARASRATSAVPCNEEVKLRVAYGRPTLASVDIVLPDGTAQRVVTEIVVRDLLIAGLGDWLPPATAIPTGRCISPMAVFATAASWRRPGEYYRPAREGFSGNRSCVFDQGEDTGADNWGRQARAGRAGRAIARFTAIRCAPRSRLRSRTRGWR